MHLDPYLSILVDELLSLSNRKLFDAYQNAPFQLKLEVFMFVLEYPGIGKVFNVMGSGAYQGCELGSLLPFPGTMPTRSIFENKYRTFRGRFRIVSSIGHMEYDTRFWL